jgi:toxin YoeB
MASRGLKSKAEDLIDILKEDPYQSPPSFEKLIGDLSGAYSRRINIQHRLVYRVSESESEKIVKVLRLWSHYE